MQKSITASEGTVAVSDDVTLLPHLCPQQEQQQQQQQQQQPNRTSQADGGVTSITVPLAEMEEFSEMENSASTLPEACVSTESLEGPCKCPTGADADAASVLADCSGGSAAQSDTRMNGPLQRTVVDVNCNGKHRRQSRHSQILKYQDLLDTFMDTYSQDSTGEAEEGDLQPQPQLQQDDQEDSAAAPPDYNFLEFAEKYYNVHCANTGYSGAFSKTVNMVRRKSLAVSHGSKAYVISKVTCDCAQWTSKATTRRN